jgi:hypothetical protein
LADIKLLGGGCSVTQAVVLTAAVLRNVSTRQILFYQIRLALAEGKAGRLTWSLPRRAWFFRGTNVQSGERRQFGFDDDVTSFGEQQLIVGTEKKYNFDLLPRLADLIREGAKIRAGSGHVLLDNEWYLSWPGGLGAPENEQPLGRICLSRRIIQT